MTTAAADYHAAMAADAERRRAERAHRLSVACPLPRCPGRVGEECRTPNGYVAYHEARRRLLLLGDTPKAAQKPRLTDPQAQQIEVAAECGQAYAPGQYANFGGDAARRAVGDALVRHGLMVEVSADEYGERTLHLTDEGWRTYWHARLVIRRLPEERHAETCPCGKESA